MATKVGRIVIDLVAGTAEFTGPMAGADSQLSRFGDTASKSGRKLREFGDAGRHTVTDMQATSASLRVLEGGFTNSLRAAERFVSSLSGVGPVVQALFPVAGGIALLGVIDELVQHATKLYEGFKKIQEQPQTIAEKFHELNAAIAVSNDELRVSNDRLEQEIAKLEGKPSNGLASALDEARLAADKLAESLDKDLSNLEKLLKEQSVGIGAKLLGKAGTDDIQEDITAYHQRINKITETGAEQITPAQTKTGLLGIRVLPDPDAANKRNTQTFEQLRKEYSEEITKLQRELQEAQHGVGSSLDLTGTGSGAFFADAQSRINTLQGAVKQLNAEFEKTAQQYRNTGDTQIKQKDQAKAEADAITRPYEDKLNELAAEFIGLKQNLASIGQGEVGVTLAHSFEEAQKQIAKLNDERAKLNAQPLTLDEEVVIQAADDTNALAKAEVEWKTKLDSTTTSIQERIQSLKLLTAAIGEGYEAQQKASVETQLIEKFGKQYNDQQFLSQKDSVTHETGFEQIDRVRKQLTTEDNTKHENTFSESVDKIRTQIELEESLARTESTGAEAVRTVALAYQLREAAQDSGLVKTKQAIQAEIELASAQKRSIDLAQLSKTIAGTRETASTPVVAAEQQAAQQKLLAEVRDTQAKDADAGAKTLANLQQEIDATNRLTLAQVGGAEAVRQAQLENRIAEIRRTVPAGVINPQTGQSVQSEEIQKTTQLSESQRNRQVVSESLKTGLNYQNRLSELSQEIAYLKSIKGTKDETLATDISLKEAEKEQVQVLSQQAQVLGTARDGLRAFFAEMAQNGVSAAKEVHDALKQTFDSLNDQLAKAISGQKTNWASFFQGISADIAKVSLRNLEATIASKFAGPAGQGGGTTPPGAAPGSPSSPHGILQTLGAAIFGKPAASGALGKRDGNSPSTALFVTTVDGQTAANPAPSVSAAPAQTAGSKPDAAGVSSTETPDLSSSNRLPERQLSDIPNLTKSETKSVATTGVRTQPISLPEAIAKYEGFGADKNNLPTRNNNPGDIKFGPFAQSQGATKDEHSPFAKFPSAEAGQLAIPKLLQTTGYQGLTVREAIERWNGKDQANNAQYVQAIVKMTGAAPDTPISQLVPSQESKPGLFDIHLAPGTSLSNAYSDADDTTNLNRSKLSQFEFGGFRAAGGDVDSDQVHVVGEDGPELFIPGADGTIVSNDKLKEFFNNTSSTGLVALHGDELPTQSFPDIQMGDVQGALPDFPTDVSRNRLKDFFQKEFHHSAKTHTQSLDHLADADARANAEAAERGSKPSAFDRTQQAMKIATLSLATQSAGNQWLELAHGVEFGLNTAASMAGGKGGGGGIDGPAPNPNPNSFTQAWRRMQSFFGGRPYPGAVATPTSPSSSDPNSGLTLSPEPSGSGLIMRTAAPADLTAADQSNLGDFDNSELAQLDNSAAGIHNLGGGGAGSGASGSGAKLSTGLAIGGMALGLLGRIFSQPGDHHFRPGNRYYIPNFNGAYADGGDVDAGKTHLVGEKGVELFVPKSDGTIIPNHKLSEFKSSSVLTEAANGGGTHASAMRLSELKHSNVEKSFNSIGSGLPFGGYREMGGAVDPNSSYVVGEKGPELFTPPGSNGGTIVPNDKLTNNSPSQTFYVDARGTDPAAVEQRIRQGMQTTHNASVRASFKSYQEYQQRTPQKR